MKRMRYNAVVYTIHLSSLRAQQTDWIKRGHHDLDAGIMTAMAQDPAVTAQTGTSDKSGSLWADDGRARMLVGMEGMHVWLVI